MMRQGLGFGLALLAGIVPAAAQMRPMQPAPPAAVPDVRPILERACLPVADGSPVAAGIAAGKSLGFAVTAAQGPLATLEREGMVLNLAPGNCVLTLLDTDGASFPQVARALQGWLPRLGRYWAGPMLADASNFHSRKFRAGGHTVLVWEMSEEGERQLHVNIGK
jgi:hypothetical protein